MNISNLFSGPKRYPLVTLTYTLIAIALFLPLIGNVHTMIAGNGADVYQNMWDLWWSGYSLLVAHVGIFSTTHFLFWPVGANLVFQTLSPISGLISLPFQAFGLPFAYNIIFFLGFAITGLGGYILTEHVTGNAYASFFGGFAFTFSSFHIAEEMSHMDLFNIGFTAILICLFLVMIEKKKTSHAVLAGAMFFLILFMDGIEEGLLALLAILFITAYYLRSKTDRAEILNKKIAVLVAEAVLFLIALSLFWIIPLVGTAMTTGLSAANNLNSIQTNVLWSANALSFLLPAYYNGLFHNISASYYNLLYSRGGVQGSVYMGYVLIALAAYGVYKNRNGSKLWLYLLAFFLLLSLGPMLQIGFAVLPIPLPYYILHFIPPFNLVREPYRFYLVASLCLAVLSGIGFKSLIERVSGDRATSKRIIILSAISIVFILESVGLPSLFPRAQFTATPSVPKYLQEMSTLPGNFSVLALPALPQRNHPSLYAGIMTYYTTVLRKPLVGGYLTRTTPLNDRSLYSIPLVLAASNLDFNGVFNYVSPVEENYTLQSLKTLSDYNTRFIIIQNNAYNQSELQEMYPYMATVFGPPTYSDSNITVFNTTRAIAMAHLYENGRFIAYPQPDSWSALAPPYAPVAGWVPLNKYGILAVYAPYPNSDNSTGITYVNTTVQFSAFSSYPEQLSILTYPNSPNGLASRETKYLEITSGQNQYELNATLIAGPAGNIMAFVTGTLFDANNMTQSVIISNITFSSRNLST